ncbi:MAG: tetratricopeptide repeat protein, partial [Myxococcales bacterium]|nr:tetratricopeptide repeat protein [Myxococcales bacterium]
MTGVIKWACGSGVFVGILVVTFTALAAPDLHAVRERFDRGAELESQAVELFGNGDPQEAKKRLTQALKIYRQILREDPSDRDVPLRIGAILVHDNRCADVLPILSKSALDAYGVEVETLASMDRKQLNAKTKLAELAVLIGQCRLVNGPDRIGFDILEGLNSLPTDVHYLLGRRLREVAQNEQALHHLEVYLRQRPHDLRTKLVVANLQLKIGLLDDAEAMYLAILKHQPNDLAALKNLGIVQVRQKNYAVAQETLRKVIVAAPNDVAARFNLAAVLARLGKHSLAVTELRKVTSLTSCLARAWHKIGESLNALSQHSSAVIAFSEAIACDKKNAVSYAALGRLYNKINQNHQCINVTSLGHKINPEKPEILLVKGVCARDLGRLDEALDIHLRAESMNPGEPTVLLELSTDYILLHQFRDAVAVLRKVPQSARRLAQALDLLGCDQLQKRDVKLAIKSLAEAVQLAPKNPQIAVNFGVAWLTKGETTKASEIFRSVLQEQPTNLSAQIALSQILLRRSRYGRVIRRLSPLEEQIESSGPGSYVLGLAYLRARKASSAVMHLKNAEILLPNQLEIKLHLAQAWILNGQYNEAWDKLKNIDTASLS